MSSADRLASLREKFLASKDKMLSVDAVETFVGVSYWRALVKELTEKGMNIEVNRSGRSVVGYTYHDGDATIAVSKGKTDPTKPYPRFSGKKDLAKAAEAAAAQRAAAEAEASDFEVEQVSAEVANVIPMRKSRPEVETQTSSQIQIGDAMTGSLVPEKDPTFTPFGNFDDVLTLIKSRLFYPVFLTGPSGTGKTMLVQQACAMLKREVVRVQVTPETDEDDLIGGFRLINGETIWFDGPITLAAKRGAVCLVDEIDYGTGKISCLQGILEQGSIFIKKINMFVPYKEGFNIIATANTKGRGSEEGGGRYINTQIMNEAFLERFGMTLEQDFPAPAEERKILEKNLILVGKSDDEPFAKNLVQWAETIRQANESAAMDDTMSTRRLVHIVRHYGIFGDQRQAVEKCVARFDAETKASFIQLWDAIVPKPEEVKPLETVEAKVDVNDAEQWRDVAVNATGTVTVTI
jgi:hypothetical protein